MMTNGRYVNWLILLLIIFSICLNFVGFINGIDWGDDYAGYILQARALNSGDFGRLAYDMRRNDFILNYPWGFPLLISPVVGFFESDLLFFKRYIFFFFVLSLPLIYFLFRQRKGFALMAVLLLSCSPYIWHFKNHIFSDFPALLFCMASLALISEIVVRRKIIVNIWIDGILLGIVMYAAFFVRTHSAVLLLTLLAVQITYLKRESPGFRLFTIALTPYVVFFLLKMTIDYFIPIKAVSYLAVYRDLDFWNTIGTNIIYYLNVWSELFRETLILQKIDGIMAGVFILLAAIGIGVKWRSNLLYIFFVFFSTAVLLISPFYQGLRYLIPVIPIFFYFSVEGVFFLFEALRMKSHLIAGEVFCLSVAAFFLHSDITFNRNYVKEEIIMDGPNRPGAIELFAFLKANTDSSDLIGFWKPRVMLLNSGRNGKITRNYEECVEKRVEYYVHYTHALADQMEIDSVATQPAKFKMIFNSEYFKVFKVVLPEGESDDSESPGVADGMQLVATIDHSYFASTHNENGVRLVPLWSNDTVVSRSFHLRSGKYLLAVKSRGTPAHGEEPYCQIFLNGTPAGSFKSHQAPRVQYFHVTVERDEFLQLKLKMENDLNEDGEDRNALIYYVKIYKPEDE
jgi:hypothetical protein